jgi:hypothetical protein
MDAHVTKSTTLRALLVAMGLALPGAMAAAETIEPTRVLEQPAADRRPSGPLAPLAWLEGCWRGIANDREFREHWLPLRGDLLVGASHTVHGGKTQSYEYLRIENRADGIYYVALPAQAAETAWKLEKTETDDGRTTFTFVNPAVEFPRQIAYRRDLEGWLYATLDGQVKAAAKQVIYPMRRADCETGELIRK